MNRERWEQIRELFTSALERPAAERQAYLHQTCAGDTDLQREVERLLDHSPSSPAILDRRPVAEDLLQRVAADARLSPGEVLAARFEIVRHLGAGGMGDVYEAIDRTLGGRIAIKTIRHDIASNPQAIARFQREIALARKITHPNICRVFDMVTGVRSNTGARVDFLTMEYLEGETLSSFLRRQAPLSLTQALPIIDQIAAGLDAAHAARIMHRDLKASNIMVATDASGATRAVITDFGLARSIDGGDTIATGSGWGAGTPAYMAPEQVEGRVLSHAADLYSLGVVMYEMATGAQPYSGESPLQVAVKRIKEAPARPSDANSSIDPVWEAAILKCLAYEPAQRFHSGRQLIDTLRGGRLVRVPSQAPTTRKWLPAAIAAALALTAGLVYWQTDGWFAPSVPADVERLYSLGVNAIHDGAYHTASQLLTRATQQQPAFAAAHARLAEAWQELDYRDRAREELVKAMDARPRSKDERLLRDAVKATLTGQWDQALSALQARVSRASNPTDALMDVALLQDRAGRSDQAIAAYRAVIDRDPNRPGALVRLAELLTLRGQSDKAMPLLNSAADAYRSFSNPEGQGRVLLQRATMERNIPAATGFAKQAEQMAQLAGSQSLLVRARLRQAQTLDATGEIEAAKTMVAETIRVAEQAGLGSIAAQALYDLGYQLFAQRNTEAAQRYFEQSMQVAQRYGARYAEANARLGLADARIFSRRYQDTEALLQQADAFFTSAGYRSRQVQVRLIQGDRLRAASQFEPALKLYEEASRLAETDYDRARIEERRAHLLLLRLRYEEAAASFAKAVEFRERTGERLREQFARISYALSLRHCGRFDESQKQLDILAAQKPTDPSLRIQLAHHYAGLDFQRGRYAESIEALLKLLAQAEEAKQDSQVRDLKSEICIKAAEAGQADRALRYCNEMLPLRQGSPSFQIDLYSGLALAKMKKNRLPEAIADARKAVALAVKTGQKRDVFYQGMILTEALHAAANPEWRPQREAARRARQAVADDIGPQAMKSYMTRPLLAAHWKTIETMH